MPVIAVATLADLLAFAGESAELVAQRDAPARLPRALRQRQRADGAIARTDLQNRGCNHASDNERSRPAARRRAGARCASGVAARQRSRPQPSKKLYCWNEHGRKVCGDALPPEAADSARTEISAKSGLQTGEVAAR